MAHGLSTTGKNGEKLPGQLEFQMALLEAAGKSMKGRDAEI